MVSAGTPAPDWVATGAGAATVTVMLQCGSVLPDGQLFPGVGDVTVSVSVASPVSVELWAVTE